MLGRCSGGTLLGLTGVIFMSMSKEWTEWHLTPFNGWVPGSSRTDSGSTQIVPRPSDAVATYRYSENLNPGMSKVANRTELVWRNGDLAAESELTAKYGACPNRI